MAEMKLSISVGDIQQGARERISANSRAVLTYLAIFIPLTSLANVLDDVLGLQSSSSSRPFSFEGNNGLIGLIILITSLVAQYHLFGRMLGMDRSRLDAGAGRIVFFIGLAIVSFLGVGIATIFLIFPGLFLAARWLMSPSIYINQGLGVFASLGESWQRTRGNTGSVILAILLLFVLIVLTAMLLGGISAALGMPIFRHLTDGIISEVFTVTVMAMSVATYRLLNGYSEELSSVFE